MNHHQEILMSNSNSNNYTLCNALEQNVTLVRNCNELVTHLVNAYPDRVQQFAKKAFRINVKEKRPFSLHDYPYLTKGNFRQIMHKLKGQTIKVTQMFSMSIEISPRFTHFNSPNMACFIASRMDMSGV